MKPGVHQDDLAVDLDAGLLGRGLEISDVDIAEVGDVRQIEADGRAAEPLQRTLVDRRAARPEVDRRIDVRADVLEHRDVVDGVCEGVALLTETGGLGLLVVDVREDDRRGEQGMRGHAVLDTDAEIDQCAHR